MLRLQLLECFKKRKIKDCIIFIIFLINFIISPTTGKQKGFACELTLLFL